MTTSRTQQSRTATPNAPPAALAPGQLFVEMGTPLRLWTGVPSNLDATGRKLLIDTSVGVGGYLPLTGGTLTGPLTIASGNLLIGTTTDAGYKLDVNATAASARFSVTGAATTLLVHAGTVPPPAPLGNVCVTMVGPDAGGTVRQAMVGYAGNGILMFRRAEGTASAPAATGANLPIGSLQAYGYASSNWTTSSRASINLIAANTWSDTAQGTAISFNTTPINAVTGAEAMRVSPSGNLLIGTTVDAVYLIDALSTVKSSRVSVTPGTTALVLHGNVTAPPTMLANTALQIVGATTGIVRQEMVGFAGQSYITLRRSEGTASAPAATGNGVGFGGIQAAGHTGAAWNTGSNAAIVFVTGGLWSPSSTPTIIAFTTTPIGATTGAEAMRIAPSGNLLIGTAIDGAYRLDMVGGAGRLDAGLGGVFPASVAAGALIVGAADAAQPIVGIAGFGTGGNIGKPIFQFYRANGTRAAPSAVQSGNNLATINVFGYGATTFGVIGSAAINFVAAETFTDAAHGTAIGFSTTPTGSIVSSEAARFSPSGNLLIGTTTDGAIKLDCNGPARVGTFGANGTVPIVKPTVSGAKGSNAALASLLAALVSYGLITDTTGA